MKKWLMIALFSILLTACGIIRPHKIDIEQGNIITRQDVRKLKPGMSESEVRAIMGTPVLVNLFTPNRIDYVYTLQPGYGPLYQSRVIGLFRNGVLQEVITR